MKIFRTLLISLVVLALAAGPALAADQPKPQTLCPVLGGNIDKKVYADYQGKRIYFCCQGCDAEFKKDPEKYMKKIHGTGDHPGKVPRDQKIAVKWYSPPVRDRQRSEARATIAWSALVSSPAQFLPHGFTRDAPAIRSFQNLAIGTAWQNSFDQQKVPHEKAPANNFTGAGPVYQMLPLTPG